MQHVDLDTLRQVVVALSLPRFLDAKVRTLGVNHQLSSSSSAADRFRYKVFEAVNSELLYAIWWLALLNFWQVSEGVFPVPLFVWRYLHWVTYFMVTMHKLKRNRFRLLTGIRSVIRVRPSFKNLEIGNVLVTMAENHAAVGTNTSASRCLVLGNGQFGRFLCPILYIGVRHSLQATFL